MSASSAATIRLPMPHAGQQTVLQHPARFKWLDAGRRWNKTTLDVHVAVEKACKGREVFWGAPTYDQVRIGWNELRRACGGAGVVFHETRLEARFPTGGLVRFRSLDDPDNARGFTADDVIVDEAAKCPELAWYEVIRPMLMSTGGTALVNGTPWGRNWFWRECMRAQSGDAGTESVAWVGVPTVGAEIVNGALLRKFHPMENPRIAWNELENMFDTLPERVFRQEILAEFLEDAGGVFRNVDGIVDAALTLQTEPSHPVRQYIMGVDLAKSQDFTVCVVADLLSRQVVAFERFNRSDWPLQKARIALMAKTWNDALIYLDSTGLGNPIYDDLRAYGLRIHPYTFTASTKEQLINHAVLLVEQQQVTTPHIPVLIHELKSLEYTRSTATGRYQMRAPDGMHDDAAMAFCLMCWGLGHGSSANILSSNVLEFLRGSISDIRGDNLRGKVF